MARSSLHCVQALMRAVIVEACERIMLNVLLSCDCQLVQLLLVSTDGPCLVLNILHRHIMCS